MATVGTGTFTYDLREDWATLPAGESFGFVSAVATDSAGRLVLQIKVTNYSPRPSVKPNLIFQFAQPLN